jgi:Subtilase family/Secretion system C-terminal sorting domain
MKKIILTFIVAALSLATNYAQISTSVDTDKLLIYFPPTTRQTAIDSMRIFYHATEIKMLPNTKVRLWQLTPFEVSPNIWLSNSIQVSDHASTNTQVSNWTQGQVAMSVNYQIVNDTVRTPKPCPTCRTIGYQYQFPKFGCLLIGSYPITVAVADCGLASEYINGFTTNPANADLFVGKLWKNSLEVNNAIDDDNNGYKNDSIGWNWVSDNSKPIDDHNHGSHVNGILAQTMNSVMDDPSENLTGVTIMNLKTQGANGSGSLWSLIQAIDYAMGKRARVMNLSLSYKGTRAGASSSILRKVINLAGQQPYDMLFVVAAGNNGVNLDDASNPYTYFPAAFDNVNMIVVGADSLGQKASFSNYGNISVDIAAPGFNISSTVPGDVSATMSGTSMATPFVAATAALLGSTRPWNSMVIKNLILNRSTIPTGNTWNTHSLSRKVLNTGAILGCSPKRGVKDLSILPGILAKSTTNQTELAESLMVFPNPFDNIIQINVMSENETEAEISIQNAFGQVVLSQKMLCKGGENTLDWQSNEVQKGIYIVKVQFPNQLLTQKILKQ